MRTSFISLVLAATLSLTACEGWKVNGVDTGVNSGNPVTYCQANPAVCVIAGVVVAGGVALIVSNANDDDNPPAPPAPSDKRLKEDLLPVMKLENGIQLYAFHYKGDQRMFVGVVAQDLLEMPEFRGAVSMGADGFYRVDYAKLGLPVMNAAEMLAAGNRAASL